MYQSLIKWFQQITVLKFLSVFIIFTIILGLVISHQYIASKQVNVEITNTRKILSTVHAILDRHDQLKKVLATPVHVLYMWEHNLNINDVTGFALSHDYYRKLSPNEQSAYRQLTINNSENVYKLADGEKHLNKFVVNVRHAVSSLTNILASMSDKFDIAVSGIALMVVGMMGFLIEWAFFAKYFSGIEFFWLVLFVVGVVVHFVAIFVGNRKATIQLTNFEKLIRNQFDADYFLDDGLKDFVNHIYTALNWATHYENLSDIYNKNLITYNAKLIAFKQLLFDFYVLLRDNVVIANTNLLIAHQKNLPIMNSAKVFNLKMLDPKIRQILITLSNEFENALLLENIFGNKKSEGNTNIDSDNITLANTLKAENDKYTDETKHALATTISDDMQTINNLLFDELKHNLNQFIELAHQTYHDFNNKDQALLDYYISLNEAGKKLVDDNNVK